MSDDETRVFTAPTAEPDPNDLVGSVLAGRYRILELLGVGAMGAVYLGQHLKIGRKDAIKVLHSAMARDPDAIARFDRGARNVGAIRHPNVCTIYDFSDTDQGLQYLAMEFVPGDTLKDVLDREGTLGLERSSRIAEQAASALHAAHQAGIVHRDLKPANIMIAKGHDGEDIVKVVDFDISKGSSEPIEAEVTRLGYVVGTPEYMSPEQLWGGALDGRSDVYSLALVLCRMLTGKLPFRGENLQDIMSARLTDTPLLTLEELAPGKTFPPGLQRAIDGALQRRVTDRTPSAAEFASELRASGADPSTRAMPAEVPQTRVVPPSEVAAVRSSASGEVATASGSEGKGRSRMALGVGAVVIAAGIYFGVTQFGAGAAGNADPGAGVTSTDSGAINTTDLTGDGAAAPTNTAGANAGQPNAGTRGGTPGGQTQTQTQRPNTDRGGSQGAAAPNTTPSAPPASGMTAERAAAFLNADRTGGYSSDASVLRAIRDSAQTVYSLAGMTDAQAGKAAFIATNVSLLLKDAEGCKTWGNRAVAKVNSRSNTNALQNCSSLDQ